MEIVILDAEGRTQVADRSRTRRPVCSTLS